MMLLFHVKRDWIIQQKNLVQIAFMNSTVENHSGFILKLNALNMLIDTTKTPMNELVLSSLAWNDFVR